ncbi:MAG: 3-deoxy-manno-octulosonate cytidylyltransferase [Verrucomicrobiota bacterium]
MSLQTKISVVIPARMESSRLPGKILLDIGGKPMLRHVWERALEMRLADEIVIATDSSEVMETAQSWGAVAHLTPKECPNGTARIATLLDRLIGDFIINLQGDEPLMESALLDGLAESWRQDGGDVVTAVRRIEDDAELRDPNLVKVVLGQRSQALYFSRSPVPFLRDAADDCWVAHHDYWAHIGIYGYSRKTLEQYSTLAPGTLEQIERLEQLRFLEHGFSIRTVNTQYHPLGIDTPQDLERARALFATK